MAAAAHFGWMQRTAQVCGNSVDTVTAIGMYDGCPCRMDSCHIFTCRMADMAQPSGFMRSEHQAGCVLSPGCVPYTRQLG